MSKDTEAEFDKFVLPTSRTPKESKKSSKRDVRKRRADEYERNGLERPDAFEACFAAIQADLLRIGFGLGDVVNQLLADEKKSPEALIELEPSASIYLRVTRQIERYRQLEIRQAEVELRRSNEKLLTSGEDGRKNSSDKAHRGTPR